MNIIVEEEQTQIAGEARDHDWRYCDNGMTYCDGGNDDREVDADGDNDTNCQEADQDYGTALAH